MNAQLAFLVRRLALGVVAAIFACLGLVAAHANPAPPDGAPQQPPDWGVYLPAILRMAGPPIRDPSEMVPVPAGPFQMGCDPSLFYALCDDDQLPLHIVQLSAFRIDKYEVTNARYAACVRAGDCTPPRKSSSETQDWYYGNPAYAEHPVLYVDWDQAQRFCQWSGKRLPTEAEWEKAGRGDRDTRMYPWGNELDSEECERANYDYCFDDTVAVGSYPASASPYGALDMAGNVWEWVADWYNAGYYSVTPSTDPQGPAAGTERVQRSGGITSNELGVRVSRRSSDTPDSSDSGTGFRCVLAQ